MMKRIFILSLLIALVAIYPAFADTARAGSFASGLQGVVGIGDVSSGIAAEVNSNGGFATTSRATAIGDAINANNVGADTLIYTGACYVQGIYLTGNAAGNWAEIYDGTDTTGTLRFDPALASNTSSISIDAKGAPFTTGIYVNVVSSVALVSVVYDY